MDAVARLGAQDAQAATASAIADALGVTRAGARPQLQALEKKGLVKNVPIVVKGGYVLTAAGKRALGKGDASPEKTGG